ncbi:hypothetical protein ACL03H_02050 [Saccharopolyspora sp. MS10]|uniref:hypothetical protein n=1 Tax=Saccharopolyspora sp. MS10 TaxID=3385973 RepID=UPI0039A17382
MTRTWTGAFAVGTAAAALLLATAGIGNASGLIEPPFGEQGLGSQLHLFQDED